MVDAELVAFDGARVDFTLLHHRVSRVDMAHSVHLVCFDLLEHPAAGVLLGRPLVERRAYLEQLLAGEDPLLTVCPQSDSLDQGEEWLHDWAPAGIEGVVIKRAAGVYRPGRRDWLKRRTRYAVDLVVGGVTGHAERPQTLLLGEPDRGTADARRR